MRTRAQHTNTTANKLTNNKYVDVIQETGSWNQKFVNWYNDTYFKKTC